MSELTIETLLNLDFENGKVYEIGTTPAGPLIATGTMENAQGSYILVAIGGFNVDPVPLESFMARLVPIEFYEEPKIWEGRI